MYFRSNAPLRHGGLSLGRALAAALFGGSLAAVAGCPGPVPQYGAGGGGDTSSSATSTSSSTSASSTSASSTSSSTSASSSSSSSSSGSATCAADEVCAATPTMGWTGPVELVTDATQTSCPAGTSLAMEGGIMVTGAPAVCSCDCGQPGSVTCGAPHVTVSTSSTCVNAQTCATVSLGSSCTQLNAAPTCNTGATALFASVAAPAMGGACAALQGPPMLQPAHWTKSVLACAPSSPASCGGGICAPNAAKLCIVQAGDLACPAGPYATKLVIDTVIDDTRGCSACSCLAPIPTCKGTATLSNLPGCGQGTSLAVPSDCVPITSQPTAGIYAMLGAPLTPIAGACAPSGGLPTGGVTSTGTTTICCM